MNMRKTIASFICGLILTVSVGAAAVTTYGPTTVEDNVWNVAIQLRPNESVSVPQVVFALFHHNRQAFSHNNINSLEPGKIIELPGIEIIRSIDKNEAYKELLKQNHEWQYIIKKVQTTKKPAEAVHKNRSTIASSSSREMQSELISGEIAPIPPVPKAPPSTKTTTFSKPDVAQPRQTALASGTVNGLADNLPKAQPTVAPSTLETVITNQIVANNEKIKELTEHLEAVETRVNVLLDKVAEVAARIILMEKDIEGLNKLKKKNDGNLLNKIFAVAQNYADQLSAYLGPALFITVVAGIIVVLFFLLIYLIIPRRKTADVIYSSDKLFDKEEEFNLLAGKDGSAAKLNLARAYIEMGQDSQAKDLLHQVLLHGNNADQEEAKALLEKMKK